jgi:hypothetical protein
MSTNDKTGEKLVESMRKTKAAASDKSDSSPSEAKGPQEEKPAPQVKKKTTTKPSSGGSGTRGGDPYQSGRRIWPD